MGVGLSVDRRGRTRFAVGTPGYVQPAYPYYPGVVGPVRYASWPPWLVQQWQYEAWQRRYGRHGRYYGLNYVVDGPESDAPAKHDMFVKSQSGCLCKAVNGDIDYVLAAYWDLPSADRDSWVLGGEMMTFEEEPDVPYVCLTFPGAAPTSDATDPSCKAASSLVMLSPEEVEKMKADPAWNGKFALRLASVLDKLEDRIMNSDVPHGKLEHSVYVDVEALNSYLGALADDPTRDPAVTFPLYVDYFRAVHPDEDRDNASKADQAVLARWREAILAPVNGARASSSSGRRQ